MIKTKQVLSFLFFIAILFFLFISILSYYSRQRIQEEEINTSEVAQPEIKIRPDQKVDKEKLKELSITISVDSMNTLLSYYGNSLDTLFSKFSHLDLFELRNLFALKGNWEEVGEIGGLPADRYCLINFKQYKNYWSIYLLSQSFDHKHEDDHYESIIHLMTFDSANKFINAAPIMRYIFNSVLDHSGWSDFKILSDTSFSISILDRYYESSEADHIKDYSRSFDSIGYILSIDKKGHFYQSNSYRIHSIIELSEEDKERVKINKE